MPTSKRRKKPASAPARLNPNGAGPSPAEDAPTTAPLMRDPATAPQPRPSRLPSWLPKAWWARVLLGISAAVLLIIAGVIAWLYITVQRGLPTLNGAAQLPGLSAAATVVRDSSGIPHITAATRKDLYMAQGYVHAQDRLFQMDIARRLASGRVAELVGGNVIDSDRFFRTLGLLRAAQAELGTLPADVREALDAYSAGVNAFISSHADTLPIEYTVLGAKIDPWTPADSIVYGKLMAWDLTSGGLANELLTRELIAKAGADKARQLLPDYPANEPIIVPATIGEVRPGAALAHLAPYLGGPAINSNNWVVSGAHSATGKPLLANDPHLQVQNPAVWYINDLRTADGTFQVAGVSLAGAPGVVIGHNQSIAWGMTNLGADMIDLYTETLDPAGHPGQYQHNGTWQPLTFVTDTIHIKDAADETLTITSTLHGPLINPVASELTEPTALAWSVGGPDNQITALIHLQDAHDWAGFRAALADWDAPSINFVYGDTAGNIGYQATGKIPIRKSGTGVVPGDGASGANDWTGFIPFDKLPSRYNPPDGVIVTANNRVVDSSYPYPLANYWSPGYRAARITQLISETQKLSLADMQRIQLDQHSVYAQQVAPYYAALKTDDVKLKPLVSRFANWDANLPPDSATAAIYEVAFAHLLSTTVTSALGDNALADRYIYNQPGEASLFMLAALPNAQAPWWPGGRDAALLASLQAAATDLTATQGDNPAAWQWGALHRLYFAHPLGLPPLDGILNIGPYPTGGDGTTVNTGYDRGPPNFIQLYYASTRQVTEVGNWDGMQIVIAPGQSGQPYSRFWNNMTDAWLAGQYRPLHTDPAHVAADAAGTLTLSP